MKKLLDIIIGSASKVTVNGKSYTGRSVSIEDGRLVIDGQVRDDLSTQPKITVSIEGDCEHVATTSGDVSVRGNAGSIQSTSGDVYAKDVSGSVSTVSGDVACGSVLGNISTISGDIARSLRGGSGGR